MGVAYDCGCPAYIASTLDFKLEVPRVAGNTWHTYSDSDHAGDKTVSDAKSRTGVMILLNGIPVHWRSNKQPATSISSALRHIQSNVPIAPKSWY